MVGEGSCGDRSLLQRDDIRGGRAHIDQDTVGTIRPRDKVAQGMPVGGGNAVDVSTRFARRVKPSVNAIKEHVVNVQASRRLTHVFDDVPNTFGAIDETICKFTRHRDGKGIDHSGGRMLPQRFLQLIR
jgi:hypothetical protein